MEQNEAVQSYTFQHLAVANQLLPNITLSGQKIWEI